MIASGTPFFRARLGNLVPERATLLLASYQYLPWVIRKATRGDFAWITTQTNDDVAETRQSVQAKYDGSNTGSADDGP
jgi:hypothetical protein